MRKLTSDLGKYGPEVGPRLYHVLQSQAAHAGVGARLRGKREALRERRSRTLPLFPKGPAGVSRDDAPPSPRHGR